MYVLCVDEGGFEDQLTNGSVYMIETHGENDYGIYNDKEELRFYGKMKFGIVQDTVTE